jgi:hypothetical protein
VKWLSRRRGEEDNTAATQPPQSLAAEAKLHPGGWVYEIDGEMVGNPQGDIPPEAIKGAWEVDQDGMLTGVYRVNPRHG